MTDLTDPQADTGGDEPEAWLSSPLLVEAAAIAGAPYKCPSCGVFALDEQGCTYCGWATDEDRGHEASDG